MVESSKDKNGREGLQEGSEAEPLGILAKNLTSGGLELRPFRLNTIHLVPGDYPKSPSPTQRESSLITETEKARPLAPNEFTLGLREPAHGIREGDSGDLLFEPALTIRVGNMETSVSLINPGGLAYLADGLPPDVLEGMPREQKEDMKRRTTYLRSIEDKLNEGVNSKQLLRLALTQLQEYRMAIEPRLKLDQKVFDYPDASPNAKNIAAESGEQRKIDLGRIDTLVNALESGDTRATVRFSILGQGYGSYTVRLRISLRQSSR